MKVLMPANAGCAPRENSESCGPAPTAPLQPQVQTTLQTAHAYAGRSLLEPLEHPHPPQALPFERLPPRLPWS